jgi:hypothetical protein
MTVYSRTLHKPGKTQQQPMESDMGDTWFFFFVFKVAIVTAVWMVIWVIWVRVSTGKWPPMFKSHGL